VRLSSGCPAAAVCDNLLPVDARPRTPDLPALMFARMLLDSGLYAPVRRGEVAWSGDGAKCRTAVQRKSENCTAKWVSHKSYCSRRRTECGSSTSLSLWFDPQFQAHGPVSAQYWTSWGKRERVGSKPSIKYHHIVLRGRAASCHL